MAELSITDGSLYLRPADIFSIAQERNSPKDLFNSHRRLVIPSSGPCWRLLSLVRMPFQPVQADDGILPSSDVRYSSPSETLTQSPVDELSHEDDRLQTMVASSLVSASEQPLVASNVVIEAPTIESSLELLCTPLTASISKETILASLAMSRPLLASILLPGTIVLALLDYLVEHPEKKEQEPHQFDRYLYAKGINRANEYVIRKCDSKFQLPSLLDQLVACFATFSRPVTPLLTLLAFLSLLGLRGLLKEGSDRSPFGFNRLVRDFSIGFETVGQLKVDQAALVLSGRFPDLGYLPFHARSFLGLTMLSLFSPSDAATILQKAHYVPVLTFREPAGAPRLSEAERKLEFHHGPSPALTTLLGLYALDVSECEPNLELEWIWLAVSCHCYRYRAWLLVQQDPQKNTPDWYSDYTTTAQLKLEKKKKKLKPQPHWSGSTSPIKTSPISIWQKAGQNDQLHGLRRDLSASKKTLLRALHELHQVSHLRWQEADQKSTFDGLCLPVAYVVDYPLLKRISKKLSWPDVTVSLFKGTGGGTIQSMEPQIKYYFWKILPDLINDLRELHLKTRKSHNDVRDKNFGLDESGRWVMFDYDRTFPLGESIKDGGTQYSCVTDALIGQKANTSHDITSLGIITLYILLSGKGPEAVGFKFSLKNESRQLARRPAVLDCDKLRQALELPPIALKLLDLLFTFPQDAKAKDYQEVVDCLAQLQEYGVKDILPSTFPQSRGSLQSSCQRVAEALQFPVVT